MKKIIVLFCLLYTSIAMAIDSIKDFSSFTTRESPNDYLVCPTSICQKADLESPTFQLPVSDLIKSWENMINNQPRTQLIISDTNKHQRIYIQRSAIFRFPDYITVQFIPLDDQNSTIIVYSASKYGHYDFGVNKKRVNAWIDQLNNQIPKK